MLTTILVRDASVGDLSAGRDRAGLRATPRVQSQKQTIDVDLIFRASGSSWHPDRHHLLNLDLRRRVDHAATDTVKDAADGVNEHFRRIPLPMPRAAPTTGHPSDAVVSGAKPISTLP